MRNGPPTRRGGAWAAGRLVWMTALALAGGCERPAPGAEDGTGGRAETGDQTATPTPAALAELPDLGPLVTEPDDPDHPIALSHVPGRVSGFYERSGDADRVRLPRAGLAAIAPATIEVSPVPGVRPRLRVFGRDGSALLSVQAERAGEGVAIPNLGAPEVGDDLILEVSALSGSHAQLPYTLSVHRPERPPGDELEREPNDAPEQAQPLTPGGTMGGFLHTSGDVDRFLLAVAQPGALTLELVPDAETDAVLGWTPPDGATRTVDLAEGGQPEAVCAVAVAAGEHDIDVTMSAHPGDALARYTLAVRLEQEPVEREPNNPPPGSPMQELVDGMRGYLGNPGDEDVFGLRLFSVFDGSQEQVIRVQPPPGVDVSLQVTDALGDALTPVADAGGAGGREEVTVQRQEGTYRIVIREGSRGGWSCAAPYVVALP